VSRRFDAAVVGAGQAGPSLALRLAAAGMKVAMVERKLFGGTCVNTGCTPTKAMVASAYAVHLARRAAEYGVVVPAGEVVVDLKAVKARKDRIVAASRSNLETALMEAQNCTVVKGQARFESAHALSVGDEVIEAEKIFLNVGGRALIPDMPGLDQVSVLTNTTILDLEVAPRRLVVVGGSYVGLEFAQMFRRFGVPVTVVEKGPRLIAREDPDVSAALKDILEREGIEVRLNAECIQFRAEGSDVVVGVDCQTGSPEEVGSHVLMAVGRRPNTDDLALDRAGVETDARGFIKVDDQLRTNVEGIWALGDCNGRGAFTHTAYDDFEILAADLLDGQDRRVSERIQAYALYTDPPLGRAGMNETEARASGRRVLMGVRPMTRVARAVEKGETLGFMKVLVDADTDEVLGASLLGVGCDEAVQAVLDLMYAKGTATTLRRAMHIHPTVSELLPTLVSELKPLV
jgi:pyruvate/2-oxoglutarate dehydrogenase complex dihydrolipoamide dehydrogenase (E3) component